MCPLNAQKFDIDAQAEVFLAPAEAKDQLSRALEAGKVRRLYRRLYTANSVDPLEVVARRNWAGIVTSLYPEAVLVGRSAFTGRPEPDGTLFLDAAGSRDITMPGLRLRPQRGPGRAEGDTPYMEDGLYLSSRARAFVENIRPSRARSGPSRTLSREELEQELLTYGRFNDAALNQLRDDARRLAPQLSAVKEATELDRLIGALQGTQKGELRTDRAQARARGLDYDPRRIELFEKLHSELLRTPLPDHEDVSAAGDLATFAFYESYFSNYIEGTEFTVDEAERIVFEGEVPTQRPLDAHDILGTYQLAVDPVERRRIPGNEDEFIAILRSQHGRMLSQRKDVGPGEWKTANNHVGGRYFVDWRHVEGTLRRAFRLYEPLPAGFARAVFAMFVAAEVHPFADGNGRTARLLMNSELTAAAQQRLVITTRRRNDYIAVMRGMSANFNVEAYLRVLADIQHETATIDFTSRATAHADLEAERAFEDADAAAGAGILEVVARHPNAPDEPA